LRVQTPRAADQDEITDALALLRSPLTYCQPIARDFCGLASQFLAGQ